MLSRRRIRLANLGQLPRALYRRYYLPFMMMHQARNYAAAFTIKVPQMAESISEGTLKQFAKHVGDFVEQDEEIATTETDKIDVAVNAPEAGIIKELLVDEEDTVIVGQDLIRLEPGNSGGDISRATPPKQPESDPQSQQAKHQAVTSKGVKEPTQSPPYATPASSQASRSRGERRVKMNRMRLRIAERLMQSQSTAASLTTFNEVDMSSLIDFRKLYGDEVLKRTGIKLGFMGAFSHACVLAMRDIPAVNASIEGDGDTIVYRDYIDIHVAVVTEKGLVTLVVRNAEAMDIVTIERSIAELGQKARGGNLMIEDMAGGTFTISNGGIFGSLLSTPIINLLQTAILGLHAIKDQVVAVNGKVEVGLMMYLALTYDHRLLDGREAVQYLVKVKEYIEDPRRVLL